MALGYRSVNGVVMRTVGAAYVMLATAVLAASTLTPTQAITITLDAVSEVMTDTTLSVQAKEAQVTLLLFSRFDFEDTSRRVLATRWKKATLAQRTEFVSLLSQLVTRAYWKRVVEYQHGEVQYIDEHRSKEDYAKVNTVVVNGDAQIPVDYSLRQRAGDWFAYDIRIEGVSMVNKLRDDYLVLVKEDGMPGLLAHLKQQLGQE